MDDVAVRNFLRFVIDELGKKSWLWHQIALDLHLASKPIEIQEYVSEDGVVKRYSLTYDGWKRPTRRQGLRWAAALESEGMTDLQLYVREVGDRFAEPPEGYTGKCLELSWLIERCLLPGLRD
jgi:hypothetical protein